MAKEKSGRKKSELLKNMNYLGQRFHKLGVVEHLEAVSRLSFENAIRVINEDIFSGRRKSEKDSAQANETLKRFSQRLHELCNYTE
jgi:hypothetical protein